MKSVLISIKPKWCELIASGKKTIEVRKTKPKLETPFKCYIYCTIGKSPKDILTFAEYENGEYMGDYHANGKVIGEFVCDEILEIPPDNEAYGFYDISDDDVIKTCLINGDLWNYGKGKTLYGWHISDLKIYDKPKELSEFYTRKISQKDLDEGNYDCRIDENTSCMDYPEGGEYCEDCIFGGKFILTRPPQSWCYVEEVQK